MAAGQGALQLLAQRIAGGREQRRRKAIGKIERGTDVHQNLARKRGAEPAEHVERGATRRTIEDQLAETGGFGEGPERGAPAIRLHPFEPLDVARIARAHLYLVPQPHELRADSLAYAPSAEHCDFHSFSFLVSFNTRVAAYYNEDRSEHSG